MSIYNLQLSTFKQSFTVSNADKLEYGEIYTPFSLINKMMDLFDPAVFTRPEKKWLDIGAGLGYFSIVLFERLNQGLALLMPEDLNRKRHIIENMLYLVEIKATNVAALREMFGSGANILVGDFLEEGAGGSGANAMYDYIIGNPPYNAHGLKKVPTNKESNKKMDGTTAWMKFVKKSLFLLREGSGQLCLIVPSIWLKPDKAGIHQLLTSYKIEKMHCLTGNETNLIFKGEAQTPTCYFLLTKTEEPEKIEKKNLLLYDTKRQSYVTFLHKSGEPIPMFGSNIIQKLQKWLFLNDALNVQKTNMPSVKSKFTEMPYNDTSKQYPYINIKSCLLERLQPVLLINYSDIPQAFQGIKKLVLAHKMYGFPYYDKAGTYGISNRDNYVITGKTDAEFMQLEAYLSTKFALYVFEATRYRMKYLEKYAFLFLPDITKLSGFPAAADINDTSVANYFGLDDLDKQHINSLHRREYKRFHC